MNVVIVILLAVLSFLLFSWMAKKEYFYNGKLLERGEHFSAKDKSILLNVLDSLERFYEGCQEGYMCTYLEDNLDRDLYSILFKHYHNPRYYKANGIKLRPGFSIDTAWWRLDDLKSRIKATRLLKQAVIND